MALELGTRMILRSAVDGSPLPADRVREVCAAWAMNDAIATDDVAEAPGRNGAVVSATTTRLGDDQARWSFSFSMPDEDDPSVEWRTEITSVFDVDRTTFVARLRRDSRDHRLRPLGGSPRAPRVIRDVLQAEGVDCFDGPLRVDVRYGEIVEDAADGFVDTMLFAEDRRLPVLAIAKSGGTRGRINATALARHLAGFAHVRLIDAAALPRIHAHLGNLSLDRDSARLWWPGVEGDDETLFHPHWHGPFNDPDGLAEEIRQLVFSASRDRWREPTRVVEFDRAQRRMREEQARGAAVRLADELERLREATSESTEQTAVVDEMSRDVAELKGQLESAQQEAQDATELWEEADAERDRFAQENRSLKAQLEGARAQLRERSRGADGAEPETDDEQFAHEIRAAWDARLTEHDRQSRPLVTYEVKPGFVASIRHAGADPSKVAEVAMEIACGLAQDIASRQPHQLRTGPSGNAPARRRESDSAIAWRCYLQTKTPSARRIHYWVRSDGSIDFANVVTHDDMSIPE